MISWLRFLSAFLLLSLLSLTLVAQSPPKREFRGAWIATVTNLDWPPSPNSPPETQRSQLVSMLDALGSAGINAVVFQVRPECDALYKSPYEPWSYWLTGAQGSGPADGYDPLEFAIQEAHRRGMEIHAWFNPYRAERKAGDYQLASNHVSVLHPDWVIQMGTYRFLDPGKQVVRDYTARIIADVVRRYDIDGAHMDDYFYQDGISTQDAATFQSESRGITNLGDWRRDNVNLLIKQVYDSIKAIKPNVKWGISPRGIWKNGVPTGIVGSDNYSVIYCDAVSWLQGQYIDYINPQLYWPFGGGQDYGKLMPWWSSVRNGRHLYVGQAPYRITDGNWDATELPKQIRLNRENSNAQGSVFFRASYGVTNNPKGFADSLKNDLYKYPALVPTMEWKETVPPNAPAGLIVAANQTGDGVQLSWNAPLAAADGDSATRYVIYRFSTPAYTTSDLEKPRNLIALTGTSSVIPSARLDSSNVKYYYAVSALDRNNNESGLSNVVSVTPPTPLATPILASPLDAEQNFAQGGAVKWKRQQEAMQYGIQVAQTSDFAASSLISSVSTKDTMFIPSGLAAQQTYYWRVVAGNQAEAGGYSQPFSFKTGWPLAPTIVWPVLATNTSRTPTFVWNKGLGTSFHLRVIDASTLGAVVDKIVQDTTFLCNVVLIANRVYTWNVAAINAYGRGEWSSEGRFRPGQDITAAEQDGSVPLTFELSQNYPNPFNPQTTIRYAVPDAGPVSLRVYDLLGREVAVLVDGTLAAGYYTAYFNGEGLASGIYFYRLVAAGAVETRKMQLVR